MATTTKEVSILKVNPNGTSEKCNDKTQYSISYSKSGQYYYISIIPCTLTDWGGISYLFDFVNRSIPLVKVNRRSAKVQNKCEMFLTDHSEEINTAYLCDGVNGVKEVVRDLWNLSA